MAGKITRFVMLLRAEGGSSPSCSSQWTAPPSWRHGGHVVRCKLGCSDAEVLQEIGVAEVKDAGEREFERVDGAAGAWPDGLDGYLVLGLGECAFAGETGVDRGDAGWVPACSPRVFSASGG